MPSGRTSARRPWFGRPRLPRPAAPDPERATAHERLPGLYWLYWAGLFLAVSVEFCMIFWSANYLAALGMGKANAAQAVGLFLAGMVFGRLAGSRLVRRFSSHTVVIGSILVAAVGFGVFWAPGRVVPALVGLFVAGLGVASMYPLLIALAIGVTRDSVRASARATLASAAAILILPLVLGRLADRTGIRPAYGVVGVLLVSIFVVAVLSSRRARSLGPV
jgi:fucose permease